MTVKPALLAVAFAATDLIIYFAVCVLLGLVAKDFSWDDAVKYGPDAVIGRIIHFQVVVELVLLGLVFHSLLRSNLFVLVAGNLAALIFPFVFMFKEIRFIPDLFWTGPLWNEIGPAGVLLVSTLFTWILVFRVARLW